MRKLMILSLILLAAYSCKKDDNGNGGQTIVSGILVENHTNKPIPNVEVYLTAQKRGSWSGGWGMNGAGYQKTDSTGHFQFSFFAHPDSMYGIWPRPDTKLYYEGTIDNDGYIRPGEVNNNMKVRVDTKGWIKYVVINEPPLDTIKYFTVSSSVVGNINTLFKDTTFIEGGYVAGVSIQINYQYIAQKDTISNMEFKYLPPFDTLIYIIKY